MNTYERRLGLLAVLVAFAMTAVLAQLFKLQLLDAGEWREAADGLVTRTTVVRAPRGKILDARGRVLSQDAPAFDLAVVPAELPPEPRDYSLWGALARLLRVEVEELLERVAPAVAAAEEQAERELAAGKSRRSAKDVRADHLGRPRVICRAVCYEAVREIELRPLANAGFRALVSRRRGYPGGEDFVHVTGRHGADGAPSSLLEARFDVELSGRDGEVVLRRTPGRRASFTEVVEESAATPGADLHLTIDAADQRMARQAVEGVEGAFVVIDADSGAVLAMISTPVYPPEEFAQVYADWSDRPPGARGNPLRDLACRDFHAPGSVLKPVTALAALVEGGLDPEERIHCDRIFRIDGRPLSYLRCNGVHGDVNLHEALARSCNIYFQTLLTRIEFGAFVRAGRRLGFGQGTGIELEPKGHCGNFAEDPSDREAWPRNLRIASAIGQGDVRASAAQVARAYAAIATGRLPALHVVARVGDRETPRGGEPLGAPEPALARIRAALLAAAEPGGTAAGYGLRAYGVACKTGTAQIGDGRLHNAWIAGYAPPRAGRPRIAFAIVVLATDLHGADECGPRLRSFLDTFYAGQPG